MNIPKGYTLAPELIAFIKEREFIRRKKEAGKKHPWTEDKILNTYRFCNIHREDDRVTRELGELAPVGHEDLWFWWVVARLFNLPSTMRKIGEHVLPFNPLKMRAMLGKLRTDSNIFNAAYIVSTNGIAMDKVEYVITRVLVPLWKDRKRMRPDSHDTLETYHLRLMTYDGLGSFLAAQVVADMKYVFPLDKATDWWTFAASGPGSRRGLNRVMGVDPDAGWKRGAWEEALVGLARVVEKPLARVNIKLHNQDLQNCLCEFDKYRRAVEGGRPKQLYKEKA